MLISVFKKAMHSVSILRQIRAFRASKHKAGLYLLSKLKIMM